MILKKTLIILICSAFLTVSIPNAQIESPKKALFDTIAEKDPVWPTSENDPVWPTSEDNSLT